MIMSDYRTAAAPIAAVDLRITIVAAEFNREFVDPLLQTCLDSLAVAGVSAPHVVRVPGSFELIFAAQQAQKTANVVICLGVIVRGETMHFELVAEQVAAGIARLNARGDVPVIFGVLACENTEQISTRLSLGHDFAVTAIEMTNLNFASTQ